jgi:hypothetical protein
MERYEELEWTIETLKEQLNIPIFERREDEEMFLKAFYAKKEMLEYEEANDPLRKAAKKMQNSFGHI